MRGFRVYDKLEKRMIITPASEGIFLAGNGDLVKPDNPMLYLMDRYVRMDSTGLRDKNNVEIYEGDIVQYEGEYFREIADIVWYGTGSWGLHDREKYLDELIFSQAIRYDSFSGKPIYTEVEVIGNIYENPELLKEKP